jgi:putative spermidine/putrescine transport system substrate-binding protein
MGGASMRLRTLIGALALLAVLAPGIANAQTREFVIATWGDPYEAGWRKSLIPEFEKQNNVKVVWVPGVSTANVAKLRAQKDNPQIDLAMMDEGPHRQAALQGLVEKIDRSKLTHASELYDLAYLPDDLGIAFGLSASGLWYAPKRFADNKWAPPTSWNDLFRPELKGKIVVHSIANANGIGVLTAFNRMAGGTEQNVDKGFAKLKELVPAIITFDRFGETRTLIQQGAADMGTWSVEQTAALANTGVDVKFVYPKEGALALKIVATVVKGRPNQDLAYKFLNLLLSKQQQENNAEFVGIGPVNKTAKLTPTTASRVTYGDEAISRLYSANWDLIAEKRAEWTERWNKELEHR